MGSLASRVVKTKAFKFGVAAVAVAAVAGGISGATMHSSAADAAGPAYKPWSFGVLADTQYTVADDGKNPNQVEAYIVKAVDQQFINKGVKLVVAVGDTANDGDKTSIDTRALYSQDLYNAGIGFYPLRGNHEAGETSTDASWKNSASEFAYAYPQIGTGVNNSTPAAILSATSTLVGADMANNAPAAKTGKQFTTGYNFSFPTWVNLANKSLSYSFRYNNATFVLLDQFTDQSAKAADASDADTSTSTIGLQQAWIDGVLQSRRAGTQAFVFTHKNLLGGNHKDNLFGGTVVAADPGDGNGVNTASLTPDQLNALNAKIAMENDFISSMSKYNVEYVISGHDHHDYVSVVTSPDGKSQAHQLITQSASSKFYAPATPVSANDAPVQQDLNRVGYYIVTVDGPRVTIDYYGDANGNKNYAGAFNFVKMGSESYSLNGKDVLVSQGGSYTTVTDNTSVASHLEPGFKGTSMAILAGTDGSTQKTNYNKAIQNDVNTGWKAGQPGLSSDVLDLSGMSLTMGGTVTDQYALAMTYKTAPAVKGLALLSGKFCLLARNGSGQWVKAVTLNSSGSPAFALGAYTPGMAIGTYGIDPVTKTAWAVLDYNGEFAVGFAQ